MNAIRKCSVIGCDSDSNQNNSLSFHKFPTIKQIALKWLKNLEHLIPISLFEPVQICEKHFENRFLLKSGNLAGKAYPTLFTPKEISTGLPDDFNNVEHQGTLTLKEHNYSSMKKGILEHNYSIQEPSKDFVGIKGWKKSNLDIAVESILKRTETVPIIETTNEDNNDATNEDNNDATIPQPEFSLPKTFKTYVKKPVNSGSKTVTDTQQNSITKGTIKVAQGQPVFQLVSSSPQGTVEVQQRYTVAIDKTNNMPVLMKHNAAKLTNEPRTSLTMPHSVENISDSSKFYETKFKDSLITINKLVEASRISEKKYRESMLQIKKLKLVIKRKDERLKKLKFDKKLWFEKLTKHITNPLAKKFLWMQVRKAPKTAHGNRFTDEEKTICIYIKKQSPECYRILSKIFTLPTGPNLYKFLKTEMKKNKVDAPSSYL